MSVALRLLKQLLGSPCRADAESIGAARLREWTSSSGLRRAAFRRRSTGCIRSSSHHWRLERMPIVDRNVLRVAIVRAADAWTDIPKRVTLNEAVEARQEVRFRGKRLIREWSARPHCDGARQALIATRIRRRPRAKSLDQLQTSSCVVLAVLFRRATVRWGGGLDRLATLRCAFAKDDEPATSRDSFGEKGMVTAPAKNCRAQGATARGTGDEPRAFRGRCQPYELAICADRRRTA